MHAFGRKIVVPAIVGALVGIAAYKLSGVIIGLVSALAILVLAYYLWVRFT